MKRLRKKAKIFIVDDHEIIRFGLKNCIGREEDLDVCGEADSAAKALKDIPAAKPDLVIVDIGLEETSGIDLTRNLRAAHPQLPVIVLSMQNESVYGRLALRAGASGYVMTSQGVAAVVTAIHRVLAGEIYLSERLSARLLQEHLRGKGSGPTPSLTSLSERELEVFRLIGQWKSTGEIAQQLHLSVVAWVHILDSVSLSRKEIENGK
ncbi:MAG: response regulator transcription factor [Verrucomicrobia bacterium]|nr:response regulator transcription factor [Verrucomicrobiota bacterium]